MKIQYQIIETKETEDENSGCIGYGLQCSCAGETVSVRNITPDRMQAERLGEMLERNGVEPVHLFDVVYDLLAGGYLI